MYSTRKRSEGGCFVRRTTWACRAASSRTTHAPIPDVPPYSGRYESIGSENVWVRFSCPHTVTITTFEAIRRSEVLRAPPK